MTQYLTLAAAMAGVLTLVWMVFFGNRGFGELVGGIQQRRALRAAHKPARVEGAYRAALLRQVRPMLIRGVGTYDPERFAFCVDDLFVPTSAVVPRGAAKTTVEPSPYTGLLRRVSEVRVPIFELLARERRLLITGSAGAGKTTLLRFLAVACSLPADDPQRGQLFERIPLLESLAGNVAVYVPLRECTDGVIAQPTSARGIASSSAEAVLANAVSLSLGTEPEAVPHTVDYLTGELDQGRGLLLLDGLDEVLAHGHRAALVEAIEQLIARFPLARFVVTTRPDAASGLPASLYEASVAALSTSEVMAFVFRWCERIRRQHEAQPAVPHSPTGRLIRALPADVAEIVREIHADPHTAELASSPLLLTAMLVMHFTDRLLPIERAELYNRCTLALLGDWDMAKPGTASKTATWFGQTSEGSPKSRRLLLEPIAFLATHIDDEKFRWHEIEPQVEAMYGADPTRLRASEDLVNAAALRGGLINQLHDETYKFAFPGIRDYLAARYMARRLDVSEVVEKFAPEPRWSSATELLVGHLVTIDPDRAIELLAGLSSSAEPRLQLLAGTSLADCDRSSLPEAVVRDVATAVERVCLDDRQEISTRVTSAELLSRLDRYTPSPRPDAWCPLPASSRASIGGPGPANQLPEHVVQLQAAVEVQAGPVTNRLYARFVAGGGYYEETLWTRAGWKWRTSLEIDSPFFWEVPSFRIPDSPVVGVSWFEAMAYARWTGGELISEVVWEASAPRHVSAHLLNTAEQHLSRPTPVGLMDPKPAGGLHDMLGNVWEWTSSQYRPYPYDSAVCEDPEGEYPRVLRGGSFFGPDSEATALTRRWLHPGARQMNIGLRLMRGGAQ